MDFFRRAALYLKSKVGKTIILFAIILTVCVTVLSGFGIVSASKQAANLARQKLGAQVTLQLDMQKMREAAMKDAAATTTTDGTGKGNKVQISREPVPLSYLEELANSEYVQSYLISSSTSVNADGFTPVESEESATTDSTNTETSTKLPADGNVQMPGGDIKGRVSMGDITLNGVNDISMTSEYLDGTIELVEGVMITEENLSENVAVIEENLATENSLKVGDVINVKSPSDETVVKELTIVGIYKSTEEFTDMAFMNNAQIPYNKIYVPYTFANSFRGETYTDAADKIVFNLNDPLNVDAFIADSETSSIDFTKYTLDANNSQYENMVGPIENVASFSKTGLVIIAIFGAAILALIIMLSIKDRVNEIGVLLSLGESKVKIVGQLLSEILIILVIALGVSAFAGGPISNIISNKLVQNEIVTSQEESTQNQFGNKGPSAQGNGGFNALGGSTTSEAISELNVKITPQEFGKMGILSLLIALISTIIPSTFIMRLNPKNILSKQ